MSERSGLDYSDSLGHIVVTDRIGVLGSRDMDRRSGRLSFIGKELHIKSAVNFFLPTSQRLSANLSRILLTHSRKSRLLIVPRP